MLIQDSTRKSPSRRRGVVLILVLGMLALLALIGVTFATFASQSKIGAKNFSQTVNTPAAVDVMDYALSQLINDTDNPLSAIRGHSLKRDMYGSDASTNGILTSTVNGPLIIQSVSGSQVLTNIPFVTGGSNADFTGWILKLAPTVYGFGSDGSPIIASGIAGTMQTFVVTDGKSKDPNSDFYLLTLSSSDSLTGVKDIVNNSGTSALIQPGAATGHQFILDGRFRLAFNGPGINDSFGPFSDSSGKYSNLNPAQFANFRFNQALLAKNVDVSKVTAIAHGSPDSVGMDEDYDACDLENWFMAIQSADGNIVVPSFHRPGILYCDPDPSKTDDWNSADVQSISKILRPRSADHGPNNPFDTGLGGVEQPPTNGLAINFDVDNDGDGKTDSVWLDLGYPPRRDVNGKLYKPLFSFMVIGLNGRIPLNTAGNLAGRDPVTNSPNAAHASHLGNSVSEVDPTYGLQNAFGTTFGQKDNANIDVRTIQLQNLLAGTRPIPPELIPQGQSNPLTFTGSNGLVGTANFGDMNYVDFGLNSLGNYIRYYLPNGVADAIDTDSTGNTVTDPTTQVVARIANTPSPIPGRWGEASSISGLGTANSPALTGTYNNPARAGYSLGGRDVDDDNFNTFDPYGLLYTNGTRKGSPAKQGEYGDSDLYDSSASPILPVERIRRFVTPMDIDGSGRVRQWTGGNSTLLGSDVYGRVAFLSYFRPPGLPGKFNKSTGLLDFIPPDSSNFSPTGGGYNNGDAATEPLLNDVTYSPNNAFHGYDFYRFPAVYTSASDRTGPQLLGGMPSNLLPSGETDQTLRGTQIPTYDSNVNGGLMTDGENEADEMNLYATSRYDQPYSASDLEWLYRSQDIDGPSLSSRLSQLAPISFTNTVDGMRRRRLYSIDTWELNTYSWANDNPQALFSNNSRAALYTNATYPNNINALKGIGLDATTNPVSGGYTSILGGYRKINLNYPLPVSNDSSEPVRQKWIRETYSTLKAILPPLAVDTAEELAQLSQFVVNIVDFRDPDGTMTRFVNTDVLVTAATASTSPTLTLNTATVTNPYSPTYGTGSDNYLVQFGMEYNPVAINEVLAYSYIYNADSTKPTKPTYQRNNRFFLELVNTLTDSAAKNPLGGNVSASWLNLGGATSTGGNPYTSGAWDIVFTADDAPSRPDPITGQLLNNTAASYYGLVPFVGDSLADAANPIVRPLPSTGDPQAATATPPTGATLKNYYTVIGNVSAEKKSNPTQAASTSYEANPPSNEFTATGQVPIQSYTITPTADPVIDPAVGAAAPTIAWTAGILPGVTGAAPSTYTNKLPTLPGTKLLAGSIGFSPLKTYTKFYWVCLRRPANPFAVVSATNPMVVVDAMRFPYIDAMSTIRDDNSGTKQPQIGTWNSDGKAATPVPSNADGFVSYSSQRWQPYRGGHAVALPEKTTIKDWRYGYSEQTLPTDVSYCVDSTGAVISGLDSDSAPRGFYGVFDYSNGKPIYATSRIFHRLGVQNRINSQSEMWCYFPFNDRDFTSVAELLMVPGCPPGLFTKQFAELPVTTSNVSSVFGAAPLNAPTLDKYSNGSTLFLPSVTLLSASNPLGNIVTFPTKLPPVSYPYLIDKFFYSAANIDTVNSTSTVDNQTSAGWYKMFEFFEVPSQSMGAFGPVAQGGNFDWFRQDVRPGLVNPNLIIDEEVFFSVFGKQNSSYAQEWLNTTELSSNLPSVATYLDASNVLHGFTYNSPGYNNSGSSQLLKSAFVQFLNLRHGGSGALFGFGSAAIGTTVGTPADRPFRSLSYPDINYTMMRPAALPPTATSTPPSSTGAASGYTGDPGLKNPYLYTGHGALASLASSINPPTIPARRLFQPLDSDVSNANLAGDSSINTQINYGSVDGTGPPTLMQGSAALGSAANDNSQSPYFRTEMLQKAINLTTVRTHQYAVWITVGFFEVTRAGNPDLVDSVPALAYDQINREVGLNGRIVRYRGFYVVDRTKAIGFNPSDPGDYHNCVVYGHVIQ